MARLRFPVIIFAIFAVLMSGCTDATTSAVAYLDDKPAKVIIKSVNSPYNISLVGYEVIVDGKSLGVASGDEVRKSEDKAAGIKRVSFKPIATEIGTIRVDEVTQGWKVNIVPVPNVYFEIFKDGQLWAILDYFV